MKTRGRLPALALAILVLTTVMPAIVPTADALPPITVLEDRFDDGTVGLSRWVRYEGVYEGINCDASSRPRALVFGGGQGYPDLGQDDVKIGSFHDPDLAADGSTRRFVTSRPLAIRDGGVVRFDLRAGSGWRGCERVPDDGRLILEVSEDGGVSWATLATYRADDHRDWSHVSVQLPPGADSGRAMLRWRQPGTLPIGEEMWAIDDVVVQKDVDRLVPDPVLSDHDDGTCTVHDDEDGDGRADDDEESATFRCPGPAVEPSEGTCTVYDDEDDDGRPDGDETQATGPCPTDDDGDGVPDRAEAHLCARPLTRKLLNGPGPGRCADREDYVPPDRAGTATIPTAVDPGPDRDRDGVPARLTVPRLNLTVLIDPVGVVVEPAPDQVVPVDAPPLGDDGDPDRPAPSVVEVPVPVFVAIDVGPDRDRDRVPANATIHRGTATVDRRDPLDPLQVHPVASDELAIDPDDRDDDRPAPNPIGPVGIPTDLRHGPDGDDDLVPGYVDVTWLNVTVDRREQVPVLVDQGTTREVLDPDDGDHGRPVPFDEVDDDRDDVPDGAEPWICQVQKERDPSDGRCVRDDGSGEDGAGDNYQPPTELPNPWNG